MIFTESLGPRASTKAESHASFTESRIVVRLTNLFAMLNTKKMSKTFI